MRLPISAIWFGLLACSTGGATEPSDDAVCETSAGDAGRRVEAVVEANLACQADADCATVAVRASCFSHCTRTVNTTGVGAVDRASTLVEAHECKVWKDAGCTRVEPPCAPPTPPVCREGKCQ